MWGKPSHVAFHFFERSTIGVHLKKFESRHIQASIFSTMAAAHPDGAGAFTEVNTNVDNLAFQLIGTFGEQIPMVSFPSNKEIYVWECYTYLSIK